MNDFCIGVATTDVDLCFGSTCQWSTTDFCFFGIWKNSPVTVMSFKQLTESKWSWYHLSAHDFPRKTPRFSCCHWSFCSQKCRNWRVGKILRPLLSQPNLTTIYFLPTIVLLSSDPMLCWTDLFVFADFSEHSAPQPFNPHPNSHVGRQQGVGWTVGLAFWWPGMPIHQGQCGLSNVA